MTTAKDLLLETVTLLEEIQWVGVGDPDRWDWRNDICVSCTGQRGYAGHSKKCKLKSLSNRIEKEIGDGL